MKAIGIVQILYWGLNWGLVLLVLYSAVGLCDSVVHLGSWLVWCARH